jgi:transitional endoplasmic reticulum ATPase
MSIGKRKRGFRRNVVSPFQDPEDDFMRATCGEYMIRHLAKHPIFDEKTLEFVFWIIGERTAEVADMILNKLSGDTRRLHEEQVHEAEGERDELAEALAGILKKAKLGMVRRFSKEIVNMLESCVQDLKSGRKTNMEKNLSLLAEVFSFNQAELRLVRFLFMLKTYDEAEDFLENHLDSQRFRRRGYLANMLDLRSSELTTAIERLIQISVIEYFRDQFELTDWFQNCCHCPESDSFTSKFYRKIPKSSLPIDFHMLGQDKVEHVLKLFEKKSNLPSHVLLYGPPGTGKTSFAYALASELKTSAYEIVCEEENQSKQRRAALAVCLNMTKSGRGAIVIVDEADNMLNTIGSWFMRGETQDKGWLNRIMEEPGARVIWITNSIEMIEESVLRRFAFSLHFKPFNRRQRIQLWENVLEQNQVTGVLDPLHIERLARKYKTSAGVIDMSVKKAFGRSGMDQDKFVKAVELGLEAHQTVRNRGIADVSSEDLEDQYSVEGLNMEQDIGVLLDRLERFDHALKSDSKRRLNMNLLFYGPPGTGKSALARYIADRLDREIICKRYSDLQSMYVGQGEKNIRLAFEEAENEEAVLVIDEVDSMLFSRQSALRSWEISFTNEFLTAMEHFRGILICTTNRMTDLDQASIRRFNLKIRFDYLTAEGNIVFYKKILAGLVETPLRAKETSTLREIGNLAPGDYRTVRDQYAFQLPEELSHNVLVEALIEESKIKDAHGHKKSIGF